MMVGRRRFCEPDGDDRAASVTADAVAVRRERYDETRRQFSYHDVLVTELPSLKTVEPA